MQLDHVLVALPDLGAAAREFERRHGLDSIEGGRHPGWGTANRIVPLGAAYVELVAVVDGDEAEQSAFGRLVATTGATGGLLGWAVRTDELAGVALRLGLQMEEGSRTRPDGEALHWRVAGVDRALATRSLPFFIEWEAGTTPPGTAQTSTPARIELLTLSGDADLLASWLGPHDLPVEVVPGPPAVKRVCLELADGRSVVLD